MMKLKGNTKFGFILGVLLTSAVSVMATSMILSKNISYSNSNTDVTNVEDALNELYNFSNTFSHYKTFPYNGSIQEFKVPTTGYYKFEAWGAQGGSYNNAWGAYTTGIIKLNFDDKIYVYVGSQGTYSVKSGLGGVATSTYGGFNGGGTSFNQPTCCGERYWGSGGGATDFRIVSGTWNNDSSLKSRIMVASGGGGGFSTNSAYPLNGGYGGALVGQSGQTSNGWGPGGGASQVSGGAGGVYNSTSVSNPGGFGFGGAGSGNPSSGGGSGYYGGGGSFHIDAAGGGSSYISGYKGCVAITSASSLTPRNDANGSQCTVTSAASDITCSYHYSGLVFTNTNMIAGNASMPTHDGTGTMTGNSGNGYAKITYLGKTLS
jgi:predicted small secreted protein